MIGGCERNWDALTAWKRRMIDPYLVHGIVTPETGEPVASRRAHAPADARTVFSVWVDGTRHAAGLPQRRGPGLRDAVKRIVKFARSCSWS